MKKLLTFLGVISLASALSISVVACNKTPTQISKGAQLLATTYNKAVQKVVSENKVEKNEEGKYDTKIIETELIKEIMLSKNQLEKEKVFCSNKKLIESSWTSINEFERLSSREKQNHQNYLKRKNWEADSIIIFVDDISIESSNDYPEQIQVFLPRMNVVNHKQYKVLINDSKNIMQNAKLVEKV